MGRRVSEQARTAATAEGRPSRWREPAAPAGKLPGATWRVGVGILWLMAVFLAYYATHKPLTATDLALLSAPALHASWDASRTIARLAGAGGDLLAVGWLLLAAGALGQALWRAMRLPAPGGAESRLIGTLLGLGALGLTTFAVGLAGLLGLPATLLLIGVPVVLLWREALRQARWWWRAGRTWWRAGWAAGGVERVALLFAAATAMLTLLGALLPPTAWDALAYHLPIVRADAATGGIVLDPASPQGYQPQLVEMLDTLLFTLRGDGPAAPLHAACGALVVAIIALLAWRAGGARTSIRAGALTLAIPLVATIATWAYVDLTLAAAELAALLALVWWARARRTGERRAARGWLMAAGLCAGLALDVKYSAAYTLAALGLMVAAMAWRAARGSGLWRRIVAAGGATAGLAAVALVVGCPWILRNALVAGDPIFPYHLGSLLPQGPGWDAGRTAFMEGGGWGWSALWRGPLLPLEATLLGTQHSVEFDATLGPLLLALLPLGWVASWGVAARRARRTPDGLSAEARTDGSATTRRGAVQEDTHEKTFGLFWRWPLAYAGVMWVIWVEELARSQVAMQSRLFLAPVLALAVPAAVAWVRLDVVRLPTVSLGRVANAAVVLCLALTLLAQTAQTLQPSNLAELAGAQDRQTYLAQQLGPYAAAMAYLDTLGLHTRILFLWEPRTYLTHAQAEPDAFIDNFNALYRHCGDAPGITRCLRSQGYTHVLVYREGVAYVRSQPGGHGTPAELAALDSSLAMWPAVYHDSQPLPDGAAGWYAIYALPA